jgi:hypothetical protein
MPAACARLHCLDGRGLRGVNHALKPYEAEFPEVLLTKVASGSLAPACGPVPVSAAPHRQNLRRGKALAGDPVTPHVPRHPVAASSDRVSLRARPLPGCIAPPAVSTRTAMYFSEESKGSSSSRCVPRSTRPPLMAATRKAISVGSPSTSPPCTRALLQWYPTSSAARSAGCSGNGNRCVDKKAALKRIALAGHLGTPGIRQEYESRSCGFP